MRSSGAARRVSVRSLDARHSCLFPPSVQYTTKKEEKEDLLGPGACAAQSVSVGGLDARDSGLLPALRLVEVFHEPVFRGVLVFEAHRLLYHSA